MGGALSFLGAEHAGLDAAAPFYGTPPAELSHVCTEGPLIFLHQVVCKQLLCLKSVCKAVDSTRRRP